MKNGLKITKAISSTKTIWEKGYFMPFILEHLIN